MPTTYSADLAADDDIRDDVLHLKGPEVRPDPAKARLHLIRYAHAPRRPHVRVHLLQVPGRVEDLPRAACNRLGDERGGLAMT